MKLLYIYIPHEAHIIQWVTISVKINRSLTRHVIVNCYHTEYDAGGRFWLAGHECCRPGQHRQIILLLWKRVSRATAETIW